MRLNREELSKKAEEVIQDSKRGYYILNGFKVKIKPYTTKTIFKSSTSIPHNNNTQVFTIKDTTVGALLKCRGRKACALNFASYKNPGGGFTKGLSTQEESICQSSNLYSSLLENLGWYNAHSKTLNYGMYTDDCILSENICVFKDDKLNYCEPHYVDILTCAAPNAKVVCRYHPEMRDDVNKALVSRVIKILSIMAEKDYDVIILGAFGCGVFRNDVQLLINAFNVLLNRVYKNTFKRVVFAIPDDKFYCVFKNAII